MATDAPPARAYRAACPNCGAPVEFLSAASACAVCSFCKSTVLREGDALRQIGISAELFDDHSPLQLGVGGRFQGASFTLVGRLQYRYAEGTWNEWHALFDSGKSGWLSEDNGRYVMAFDLPLEGQPPVVTGLRAGVPVRVGDQAWTVASVSAAKLIAAQGELPRAPNLTRGFVVADVRNARDEVGTLDYSDPAAPRWSIGRSVALTALALTGLAASSEKAVHGQTVECPSCGASLPIQLSSTQSVVCTQCHAVIDLTKGVGGDLQHYAQQNALPPLIPLGTVGTLALGGDKALPWQVVGYVERCEVAGAGDSDDEQSFWREYLLYHRTAGFAFLVDAQDGWSWTVPLTGVPQSAGDGVKYQNVVYRKLYDYEGEVTYVLGEFYWQVTQNQRTRNTDYQGTGSGSAKRLNREQTASSGDQEVVWSGGETLSADLVRQAFHVVAEQHAAFERDALPNAFSNASLLFKIFFWVLLLIFVAVLWRCESYDDSCTSVRDTFGVASAEYQSCINGHSSGTGYRSGGGAFGGFSSGGGHK